MFLYFREMRSTGIHDRVGERNAITGLNWETESWVKLGNFKRVYILYIPPKAAFVISDNTRYPSTAQSSAHPDIHTWAMNGGRRMIHTTQQHITMRRTNKNKYTSHCCACSPCTPLILLFAIVFFHSSSLIMYMYIYNMREIMEHLNSHLTAHSFATAQPKVLKCPCNMLWRVFDVVACA